MNLEFLQRNADLIDKLIRAVEEQDRATKGLKKTIQEYEEWLTEQIKKSRDSYER